MDVRLSEGTFACIVRLHVRSRVVTIAPALCNANSCTVLLKGLHQIPFINTLRDDSFTR